MQLDDLAVAALASFRVTRLVTTDTIADRPRRAVQAWALTNRHAKLEQLVSCSYCAGFWVTLAVVLFARCGKFGRLAVEAFAVAGAQSLLSAADVRMNDGL